MFPQFPSPANAERHTSQHIKLRKIARQDGLLQYVAAPVGARPDGRFSESGDQKSGQSVYSDAIRYFSGWRPRGDVSRIWSRPEGIFMRNSLFWHLHKFLHQPIISHLLIARRFLCQENQVVTFYLYANGVHSRCPLLRPLCFQDFASTILTMNNSACSRHH